MSPRAPASGRRHSHGHSEDRKEVRRDQIEISVHPEGSLLAADAEAILRTRPDWIGIEAAIVEYAARIRELPLGAARLDGRPVGFTELEEFTELWGPANPCF